jgi:hypothetical protein
VYDDGGFTVILPETPAAKHLRNIVDVYYYQSLLSDINAQCLSFNTINGYDSNGSLVATLKLYETVGDEIYGPDYGTYYYVSFCYVDRDVSVTGRAEGFGHNLFLKKGWNEIYTTESLESGNGSETTDPTSFNGIDVRWQFRRREL